jgi:hypothetical protein
MQMPFNAEQLSYAGKSAMDFIMRKDPEDLYNTDRPFLKRLQATKRSFPAAKQYVNEKLRTTNDSNFQWFAPDGEVTFNRKRTLADANFAWGSAHDGFALTEEELLQNYITVTDDRNSAPTPDETKQFVNLIKENTTTLMEGFKEKFDLDLHLDGTQDADAIPGLDALVAVDPTTGVVGGIDRSVAANAYWRNQVSLDIAKANLAKVMSQQWRECTRVGGNSPNFIMAGGTFIDIYEEIADTTINRQMTVSGKGGTDMDIAINAINYKGVPIIWNPVFDDLQTLTSAAQQWESRCYMLNTRFMNLRPAEGQDLVVRRPPRAYNRYTHYWGLTWRGAMTIKRPSAMALLTVTGS